MAARRRLSVLLVPAIVSAAAGCGQAAPDLFEVTRAGADPNANASVVVNDAGSVICNRTIRKPLSSAQLIEARDLARRLAEVAALDVDLPAGRGATLRYHARSEAGAVAWWDTSPGQTATIARLTRFTKDVLEDVCGLRR